MMKRSVKNKWLKALRDPANQEKQCRGYLQIEDGRCCAIGLLVKTCGGNVCEERFHGLTDGMVQNIVNLNDHAQCSFKEIASYVSRNVKAK